MNNPLIQKLTPENCFHFHATMWAQGIDLDKFCRCQEKTIREVSDRRNMKEDNKVLMAISSDAIPMKEG